MLLRQSISAGNVLIRSMTSSDDAHKAQGLAVLVLDDTRITQIHPEGIQQRLFLI